MQRGMDLTVYQQLSQQSKLAAELMSDMNSVF